MAHFPAHGTQGHITNQTEFLQLLHPLLGVAVTHAVCPRDQPRVRMEAALKAFDQRWPPPMAY